MIAGSLMLSVPFGLSVGMITGITLGFSLGLGGLAVAPLAILAEGIGRCLPVHRRGGSPDPPR